ncbi:unnamed protein product [Arabidopsis thaliana]|uniref:Uncharacterized protein n=1 Tax=Arabidopsis thaliana TaxID=3702 RepID=Q9LSI0_ARATH|nr:unnamed protein product [Arabidopsis thaliana]
MQVFTLYSTRILEFIQLNETKTPKHFGVIRQRTHYNFQDVLNLPRNASFVSALPLIPLRGANAGVTTFVCNFMHKTVKAKRTRHKQIHGNNNFSKETELRRSGSTYQPLSLLHSKDKVTRLGNTGIDLQHDSHLEDAPMSVASTREPKSTS